MYFPRAGGVLLFGEHARHRARRRRRAGGARPIWGRRWGRNAILDAVKLTGFKYKISKNPARDAAKLIAHAEVPLAVNPGRMEFGPRALGNRLAARPTRVGRRCATILDQKVKHREDFRPFAPSVPGRTCRWLVRNRPAFARPTMHALCSPATARAEQRGPAPGRAAPRRKWPGCRLVQPREVETVDYHELI